MGLVNPFRRRPSSTPPDKPHPYAHARDAGLGAIASGQPMGYHGGTPVSSVVVAGRVVRDIGCAVPGCGRPIDDPVHEPVPSPEEPGRASP